MTKINLNQYLKRAEEYGIIPNFFMSEAYLKLSHVKCLIKNGYIYLQDRHWCLFPPLPWVDDCNLTEYPVKRVWASFLHPEMMELDLKEFSFLDYNYIFRPSDFSNMAGGKWEVFRKNCHKWSRTGNYEYSKRKPDAGEAGILIGRWLDAKKHDVHDGELLAKFAYFDDKLPIERKYLYRGKELVAINAWDENWLFINYRVCFIKLGEHFLDEFMRYSFYTDPDVLSKNKLINDGGTLGNTGLERFKDKMNPIEKHRIYSWIKNESNAD